MNINATIDRITDPYTGEYLVKFFDRIVFGGSFKACQKYCKNRKVPLMVIPAGGYAYRVFD